MLPQEGSGILLGNMICPKCGFKQPEDRYCANCGIDVTEYKPEDTPLWKRLLSNGIVQLSPFLILIIGLVLYDGDPTSTGTEDRPLQVRFEEQQQQVARSMRSASVRQAPAQESTPMEEAFAEPETSPEPPTEPPSAQSALAQTTSIRISFVQVSRGAMDTLSEGLLQNADGGGVYKEEAYRELLDRSETEVLSVNRFRNYSGEQPLNFFKGRETEFGKNGLEVSAAVTPGENSVQMRLEAWSNLSSSDGDLQIVNSNFNLAPGQVVLLSQFLPRDLTLNESEQSFYEDDRLFRLLVDELFAEGELDLVMAVELSNN